jgi:hypothetical protein
METSCAPFFYFYRKQKGWVFTMTDVLVSKRRRKEKRTGGKEKTREMGLLLEELERTLTMELLAIAMVRKKGPPYDVGSILEMAIRVLGRKKNRSIREEAVLAWATRAKLTREVKEERPNIEHPTSNEEGMRKMVGTGHPTN